MGTTPSLSFTKCLTIPSAQKVLASLSVTKHRTWLRVGDNLMTDDSS